MSSNKTTQQYDFTIETLGPAKLNSPIRMSKRGGDGLADYVRDSDRILFSIEAEVVGGSSELLHSDTLEIAGPREKIYFNPAHSREFTMACHPS